MGFQVENQSQRETYGLPAKGPSLDLSQSLLTHKDARLHYQCCKILKGLAYSSHAGCKGNTELPAKKLLLIETESYADV